MFLNKNIILLLLGQGFSGAVVSLLTFSSGLAGKWLLDDILYAKDCLHCHNSSFASLPISATLCGAFIAVFFSSNLMQKFGRKKVFLYASLIGCLGAGFAMFSLVSGLFYLFCFATFLLGFFTALNQFYRFLANEALNLATQNDKNRATAFVVAGGIMGGILGPNLANIGTLIFDTPFVGSFLFALLLCVINFAITLPLTLTSPNAKKPSQKAPLLTCLKEPNFILATLACAFGFAFMTLIMNAAPLAMSEYKFSYDEAKSVLVWHFIAMYAPSLFLAFFMKNLSPFRLILLGILFYLIAVLVALFSVSFWGFWVSLVLVGIGWAFSFNGGTFMLNAINSEYKLRLQGLNAISIFGANLLASSSVGFVLANGGWGVLNLISFGFIVIFLSIIFGLKKI